MNFDVTWRSSAQSIAARGRATAGFTLVELLVTMAVLVLMLLSVAQVVNSAASLTGAVSKNMDADAESVLVLNRMEADFDGIVLRDDLDYFFQKNAGDDAFAFFSQANGFYPSGVSGTTPQSPLALVGYRVANPGGSGALQLQRLSKALVWNGVTATTTGATGADPGKLLPVVFKPNTIPNTWTGVASGADPDFQAVGSQVFRLEICFQMKDGTISAGPPSDLATKGLADVHAVIVTFAVLDRQGRILVPDLTASAAKLADVTGGSITDLPAALWKRQIESGDMAMPRASASQVRVYQRTLPVVGQR